MKTIVLPHGYRFRKAWWGKLVLQHRVREAYIGYDDYQKEKWVDVTSNYIIDDEHLEIKWA